MVRKFCFRVIIFSSFISIQSLAPNYLDRQLKCPGYCNVMVNRKIINASASAMSPGNEGRKSLEQCVFISDTLTCERRSRELLETSLMLKPTKPDPSMTGGDGNSTKNATIPWDSVLSHVSSDTCGSDVIDVDIYPYLYSHESYRPFVRVNISISVKDKNTIAVSLRQTCLAIGVGPDGGEELCKNHSRPAWGRFYWPCRMFDLTSILSSDSGAENAKLSVPSNFSYDCFRAAPFALMTVRVAVYPQLCENVYIYRMINDHHLTAGKLEDWLPLVYIDANNKHFVKIRYDKPLNTIAELTSIVIDIVNRTNNLLIRSKTMNDKETTASLTNLKRGDYAAIVYAWHNKCSNSKCPSTYVPFNLTRDYDEEVAPFNDDGVVPKLWLPLSIAIGVLLVIAMIVGASTTVYCRSKILRRRQEAVAIQFVGKPKVFIIYTDDNMEHRRCVVYLAEYLRDTTNCEVYFDEWAFRNPASRSTTTTTEWVHNCLSKCDYYLLLFSEGCKITFETSRTYELVAERPWQEIFGLSITYVLEEILRETRDPRSKLTKFICATFNYSDENCIPLLFRSLPCRRYRLLDDLAELICHLHKIPPESFDASNLGCNNLSTHVEHTRMYYETNPNWLNARLIRANNNNINNLNHGTMAPTSANNFSSNRNGEIAHMSREIASLQIRRDDLNNHPSDERNLNEMYNDSKLHISGKYPLLPPSDVDATSKKFQLLPPDDEEIDDDGIILDCNLSSDMPLMSVNNSNHNGRNI